MRRAEGPKAKTRYTKIKNKKGKTVDVRLGFGQFVNMRIRDMVHDPSGINYIQNFLLVRENKFDTAFVSLVRKAFERYYDDFLEDDVPY